MSRQIAATYCRVSTDDQANNFSPETQLAACLRTAEQNNYDVPKEYQFFDSESGMKLDRTNLKKLRRLIQAGTVKAVIVNTSDRLTRRAGHAEELLDEIFASDARLFIAYVGREVRDTPDDRFFFTFEAAANRRWRDMLLEASKRGKRGKAETGIYIGTGRPPYGYDQIGKKSETRLVINEEQAKVIQLIFYWFVHERVGVWEITRRLHGTLSPADVKTGKTTKQRGRGEWEHSSIQRIIRNELYVGRCWLFRDSEKPVCVSVPVIVDEDTWSMAQKLMDAGREQSKRNTTNDYLMARRLKCSCGYVVRAATQSANGRPYRYYRCLSRCRPMLRGKCNIRQVRAELLDRKVWEWVCELLTNPAALKAKLRQSQAELERRNAHLSERITYLDQQIAKQSRKLKLLLEEYAETESEQVRQFFRESRTDAEQIITEYTTERRMLEEQLENATISDAHIENLERFALSVRGKLGIANFEQRRALIEDLDLRGTLALEDEQRILYVHLYTHTSKILLTDGSSS
jgi:site-specific DNA recombinase